MSDAIVTTMDEDAPFRLFDLPSELRLRIYEFALAPSGFLGLTTTKQQRFAVKPAITTQLLRTCRQVHHEADGIIYSDNEVCIAIDAHDTCWPSISEARLPQRVLEQLQHMCVILDCTNYFNASYADVDFAAFEALVSLKTLRIAMIYRRNHDSQVLAPLHIPELPDFNVVYQILERIPATTKLSFGITLGSQQSEMVLDLIGKGGGRARGNGGVIVEAPPGDLEAAATGVKELVRGCKSGGTLDVYTEARYGVSKASALTARA